MNFASVLMCNRGKRLSISSSKQVPSAAVLRKRMVILDYSTSFLSVLKDLDAGTEYEQNSECFSAKAWCNIACRTHIQGSMADLDL